MSPGTFIGLVLPFCLMVKGDAIDGRMPTSGTFCTHVPSGFPGSRPAALNWSVRYCTVSRSPSEPGARPCISSAERRVMSVSTRFVSRFGISATVWGSFGPPQASATTRSANEGNRLIRIGVNLLVIGLTCQHVRVPALHSARDSGPRGPGAPEADVLHHAVLDRRDDREAGGGRDVERHVRL